MTTPDHPQASERNEFATLLREAITDHLAGQAVLTIRTVYSLTQQDVADTLGIPRSAVSMIETGKRQITVPEANRFLASLPDSTNQPPTGARCGGSGEIVVPQDGTYDCIWEAPAYCPGCPDCQPTPANPGGEGRVRIGRSEKHQESDPKLRELGERILTGDYSIGANENGCICGPPFYEKPTDREWARGYRHALELARSEASRLREERDEARALHEQLRAGRGQPALLIDLPVARAGTTDTPGGSVSDWRQKQEARIEERFHWGVHFKQVGEHREGCFTQQHSKGCDPEAFIVHDGHERRDAIGRRRPRYGARWERFRCNDAKCGAVMLVRWDVLARLITAAVEPTPNERND